MRSKTVALVASVAALQLAAHSLDMNKVGFRGQGGVDVPSETSVLQTEPILLDSTAKFFKAGGGTLELPLSKVNQKTPYALTVLDGKMKITPGADATVGVLTPPAACQKAEYWVNETSVVTTNGEDGVAYVARWCDVREPLATRDLSETPTRIYATPRWFNAPAANQDVPPVFGEKDGKMSVFFGGHQSGKWMKWSTQLSGVQHIFLVHGCYNTWGAAIGFSTQSRYGGFVPQYTWASTLPLSSVSYHFLASPLAAADAFTVKAFLDGMPLDVEKTPPKKGFQLLECMYSGELTRADDFFYSSYEEIGAAGMKQGGDYIAEAIVFKATLSECERLEIERYLMEKWNLSNNAFAYETAEDSQDVIVPEPVGSVGVARGAQVEICAETDESTSPLVFSGEGTVRKTGAGTLVVGASSKDAPFAGTLQIEEGDVIARCGALPPVKLEAGVRYTAAAHKATADQDVENTKAAGLRLTSAMADASSVAVKDGDGWMRANAVAEDVRRVKVESGVLQLEAKSKSPIYVGGGVITALVANADFEMPYPDVYSGMGDLLPGEYSGVGGNGWRRLSGEVTYLNSTGTYWTTYGVKFARPSGRQLLRASKSAEIETLVTFPKSGDYELSFDSRSTSGRATWNNINAGQHFVLKIGANGGEFREFGVHAPNDGPFHRYRYRIPAVDAGEYALRFACADDVGGTTFFDDVRIDFLGENKEVPAFAIPHGDFESHNGSYTDYDARNTTEGWTFGEDGTFGGQRFELSPPSGVVGANRWYDQSGWWQIRPFLFNLYDSPLGSSCLMFTSAGGTATTTFVAPAGEFRLRAGIAASRGCFTVGSVSGSVNVKNNSDVEAVLTLADQTQVNLGTVTTSEHLMTLKTWPVGFTIPSEQTVTLTLRQTSKSTAFVDDLVFVSDARGCEGNLVKNPGFETHFSAWKDKTGSTTWFVSYGQAPALYYGYAAAGGLQGARMSGAGAVLYQDIDFPSKGLYRLRAYARPRSENGAMSRGNLEFDLVRSGTTVTNVIGRTGAGDVMPRYLQFVEFNYLFKVEQAGTYAFVIRKLGTDGSRDTYVDDISITCAKEELADFEISENTHIDVADGAMLRLDFTNTVKTASLQLGGVTVRGLVNEETYPEYVSGPGSLMAVGGKGLMMILR